MAYTAQPIGFLASAVAQIREYADEPSDTSKWTTDRLFPLIRNAFRRIIHDLNALAGGPIVVHYDLQLTANRKDYILPPTLGELLRIGKLSAAGSEDLSAAGRILQPTTGDFYETIIPGNRQSNWSAGVSLEGNLLRFEPAPTAAETLRLEYLPSGDCSMAYGVEGATAVTALDEFQLLTPPTEGYLDKRPYSLLGNILRVIDYTQGSVAVSTLGWYRFPIQERLITGWDPNTDKLYITPNFDFNLASLTGATLTYEIVPLFWDVVVGALSLRVAHELHMIEGRIEKGNAIHKLYLDEMKSIRSAANHRNARRDNKYSSDVPENTRGWGNYFI